MSLALFRTTLRLSQWAIIGWAVFLVLYGVLILLLFPSFQESYSDVIGLYTKSMPKGVLEALGLTENVINDLLSKEGPAVHGYLAMEYLNWWTLVAGIYAFMFGSGTVAREADRGTMEFLLSQPVPRYLVVVSKFAAFLAITAIFVVFTVAGIGLGLLAIRESADLWRLFLTTLQGGLAVVSIAAYSTLISCIFLDPRKAMAIAGGLTAGMYILSLLGPILGPFDWLQKLSLFYHFKPFDILVHGTFSMSSLLVFLTVTAVCLGAALVVFQRRKAVV